MYSVKAKSPQFRQRVAAVRKKELNKQRVKLIICLIIIIASVCIIVLFNDMPNPSGVFTIAAIVSFAAIPIFLILTTIRIVLTVGARKNLKKLEQPPFEVEVVNRQYSERQSAEYSTQGELQGYTTTADTSVSFKKADGTILKFKNARESQFVGLLKNGEKLLYHPGFSFPLERQDKSTGNICVFCGKVNDNANTKCERCGEELLI